MTLEGVLFIAIAVVDVMLWGISFVMIRAALRRPHITAVTVFAAIVPLLALGLGDYIVSVANANLGYPIPKETAQAVFRLVLLGIGGWAVWFWFLFVGGRFDDGAL